MALIATLSEKLCAPNISVGSNLPLGPSSRVEYGLSHLQWLEILCHTSTMSSPGIHYVETQYLVLTVVSKCNSKCQEQNLKKLTHCKLLFSFEQQCLLPKQVFLVLSLLVNRSIPERFSEYHFLEFENQNSFTMVVKRYDLRC